MKNFIIIGTGSISQKHVNALHKFKNIKIVAAYDIDKKKSEGFEKKFKIKSYSNLEKLFKENKKIFCAVILTPSGLHYRSLEELSKYGIKNFIIEKPLATNKNDTYKILNLKKKKKLNIIVVHQYRYTNLSETLKKFISEGKLGKVYFVSVKMRWKRDQSYYNQSNWRGTKKFDGGVIMNQCHHFIDLIFFLFKKVESVYGITKNVMAKIESYDSAQAIFKINNRISGVLEATTATRPENLEGSITVMGTKGTVVLGGFSANQNIYWKILNKNKIINYNFKNKMENAHYTFYKKFFNNFLKFKKINFIQESLNTLTFINSLEKSSKLSREVKIKNV